MSLSPKRTLCLHALQTLPDSSSQRRLILDGIRQVLGPGDEIRQKARGMLQLMEQFEKEQRELPFEGGVDGDGDGKGDGQ
jgi:hypothetical protein